LCSKCYNNKNMRNCPLCRCDIDKFDLLQVYSDIPMDKILEELEKTKYKLEVENEKLKSENTLLKIRLSRFEEESKMIDVEGRPSKFVQKYRFLEKLTKNPNLHELQLLFREFNPDKSMKWKTFYNSLINDGMKRTIENKKIVYLVR